MTPLNRATFASILFPPTILTPGREIEVRVMRPERAGPAAEDGNPKWGRPQLDGREWFSTAEALAAWKTPENRHVWVAGALREGRDGTKAGVVASACLWADLDEGGDEALARVLADLGNRALLPTLIVRSSPGKYHLWWRLAEPMALADDSSKRAFEGALAAITRVVGGDRACVDCSRVLRLPGTRNVKPWYDAAPLVEVLEAHPDRAYPFSQFAALNPPTPPKPAPAAAASPAPIPPDANFPAHRAFPHLDRCAFVRHCWDQAASLPEPLWSALSWTLAASGEAGDAVFHALSRPHPRYEPDASREKLEYARERGYKAPSCGRVAESGFPCPQMDPASGCCTLAPVRTPAALIRQGPMHPGSGFLRGGRTWRFEGEKPSVPIADFTVKFTDELVLPEGQKRLSLEATALAGGVHRLEVPGESLADPKDLSRRLAGAMGGDYRGLDTRNLPTARDAWLGTSDIRRVRVSRDFGFAADGHTFIGLDLAPDGEVRFEVPTASAGSLGLRSGDDALVDDALRLLLDRWPRVACGELAARLMVAAAMWAVVAPVLESRDGGVSPLCAWVTGPSGLGKSTCAATIQCFFGDFAERGRLVSFGSTPFSIEDGSHDFRGALMVLDDAKESTIGAGQRASLLGVLQRLHDRTARARLRSDGAQQRARGSRTTVLVNGEDVLFQEASVRARYFAIPASEAREQSDAALRVHDQIRRVAPSVTAALVRTLLTQPAWFDRILRGYLDERIRLDGALPKGDNRPRVAASAAALLAGWRLFVAVAQARGVIGAEEAARQVDELRAAVTDLAIDQVIRTASLTPGERYLADLRQLLAADLLAIDGLSGANTRGVRVGFARDDWIGVFPELSVTRCNELLHRDGDRLPSAETVGASLLAIGALAGTGKDRIASRKGDPSTKRKEPVWLIEPERLIEENDNEDL
ncbi:MAG: DNA-primase RepB domain-containing protein [Pseudomonadota bacterium]|nr:DNA-primase RepB domain-containing protein [Pseudomonadota bacterium]